MSNPRPRRLSAGQAAYVAQVRLYGYLFGTVVGGLVLAAGSNPDAWSYAIAAR